MGADPYWYYVPYEEDKNNALQKLRQREFEAGRYRPVMYTGNLSFPLDEATAPAPGKVHDTLEDAVEEAQEWGEGTGCILDLQELSEREYQGVAHLFTQEELIRYFGTDKPTRELIDKHVWSVWDDIPTGVRGVGICVTAYRDGAPSELLFMGFSWD